MKQKRALISGGLGFIGHHLARKLKKSGYYVVVADKREYCDFRTKYDFFNECYKLDLSRESEWEFLYNTPGMDFDEIYQLACTMGGAGFIFTGKHDYEIMSESCKVNLLCAKYALLWGAKVFFSSSACMYPAYNQKDPNNPKCSEDSAYPADPDSEYGWEKLFSERMYLAAHKNKGLNIRIARFHNIFGPEGTWTGGKEKAPAAISRKVAMSAHTDTIEVWGLGNQTRSFLYIDECLEGIERLMKSDFIGPVNVGSEEMISINDLVKMTAEIAGKNITIKNIPGPEGVKGRNSDNRLIKEKLNWAPSMKLYDGMKITYEWVLEQTELNSSCN